MEPLPRRPGASPRPEHSYIPERTPRIGAIALWLPMALAVLLLIIGGVVWLSL